MPIIPGVKETFDYLYSLHERKNNDYSGDNNPFFNFQFCEYISYLFKTQRDKVYAVFIAVKLARLSVVLSANKVNNESVEDTFNDLIMYATIWKCDYLERKKNEQP